MGSDYSDHYDLPAKGGTRLMPKNAQSASGIHINRWAASRFLWVGFGALLGTQLTLDPNTPRTNVRTRNEAKVNDSGNSTTSMLLSMNGHDDDCRWDDTEWRPTIFLHPGPPKTGTTSLQDWLACHADVMVDQYNAYYLGKTNPKNIPANCPPGESLRSTLPKQDVVRNIAQYPGSKSQKQFGQALRKHVQYERHNVVLSNEDLGKVLESMDEALTSFLDHTDQDSNATSPYRIVLVLGYRPFHEWLRSLYAFRFRPKWYDRKDSHKWRTEPMIPTMAEYLEEYVNDHVQRSSSSAVLEGPRLLHPSYYLLKQFRDMLSGEKGPSTDRVFCTHTMPMSDGRSPITQFENILRRAAPQQQPSSLLIEREEHALDAIIQQKSNNTTKTNVRTNTDKGIPFETDAERIALQLYADGWVDGDAYARRAVVDQVQAQLVALLGPDPRIHRTNATAAADHIPWTCIRGSALELLRAATISADAELETDFSELSGKMEAKLSSWLDSFGHCSVDYHSLGSSTFKHEPEWDQFRKCLQGPSVPSSTCVTAVANGVFRNSTPN